VNKSTEGDDDDDIDDDSASTDKYMSLLFFLDSTRYIELWTDAKRHPTYKEKRHR
jgi:hypothetical protein